MCLNSFQNINRIFSKNLKILKYLSREKIEKKDDEDDSFFDLNQLNTGQLCPFLKIFTFQI